MLLSTLFDSLVGSALSSNGVIRVNKGANQMVFNAASPFN